VTEIDEEGRVRVAVLFDEDDLDAARAELATLAAATAE
jgi:hypothetical protein